ncbi:glycosyltransferase [Cellulomonas composti]|uniref:Peptidase M14 n=1 Tax=Cellulomonas composti TaxID=266130 RepID=A0A511JB20_9CELL|nr:glycosyltransferase [Cellulomonas composti]GEL95186.1 peptidase M14 [Cellulomonas composti]
MPTLLAFPAWRDNPYLNLLYLAARGEGWDVQGTTAHAELVRRVPALRAGDVLHIHWTQPVVQPATDEAEARERLDAFTEAVAAAGESGVHVIWTVHNSLPHELNYRQLELELAHRLGKLAHTIVQLNAQTVAAVEDEYHLPAHKVVTLSHSSYTGVYPAVVGRAEARRTLGVPPLAPTIGFVGQIRPYKGITTLLAAAALLGERTEDLTLLLAGKTRDDVLPQIDAALPAGVRTVRHHDFVDDSDLQVWFRAADVMVFPYERVLNSGSVLLAATFGRPCILPREPHLVEEFGAHSWVSFYNPGAKAAESLADAIERAVRDSRRTGHDAEAFAASYTPYDMSRDFLAILDRSSAAPAR